MNRHDLFDFSKTIPKVIHQMWLGKTDDNAACPSKYNTIKYIKGLRERNAHFEYCFWTMKDVKQLFHVYPSLKRYEYFYFHQLVVHQEKCDFARYLIMAVTAGGVYLDLDMECLQPLDTLIAHRSIALVYDWQVVPWFTTMLHGSQQPAIFNGFLASAPNQLIWFRFMDYIMYCYRPDGNVILHTGPMALGNFMTIERLYSSQEYPELYINPCLIIPTSMTSLNKKMSECQDIDSFTTTNWILDGSGWQMGQIISSSQIVIKRWHLFVLIFFLVLALSLFFLLKRKSKALTSCAKELTTCTNSTNSNNTSRNNKVNKNKQS